MVFVLFFSVSLIGHSGKASTSSMTNEDFQGVPKNSPESASPCPDSSSWVYVDEPLPPVGHNFYLCLFCSLEIGNALLIAFFPEKNLPLPWHSNAITRGYHKVAL